MIYRAFLIVALPVVMTWALVTWMPALLTGMAWSAVGYVLGGRWADPYEWLGISFVPLAMVVGELWPA